MQFTGPAMLRVDGELALILRAWPQVDKSTAGDERAALQQLLLREN